MDDYERSLVQSARDKAYALWERSGMVAAREVFTLLDGAMAGDPAECARCGSVLREGAHGPGFCEDRA